MSSPYPLIVAHAPIRAVVAIRPAGATMGAEPGLGDRFVACFVAALDGARLPADPRLRAALSGYLRWATDEVMAYSPADARVPAELATPRWDFGGLRG